MKVSLLNSDTIHRIQKKWLLLSLFLFCKPTQAQTWTALPDFPGSKRDDGVAFVLGGKAYCGTGLNEGFAETGDFFAFDPVSEVWEPATGLPEGAERQYACAWTIRGVAYVFGGVRGSTYLNELWSWSPGDPHWTRRADLPASGRSGMGCALVGEEVYVWGGKTAQSEALAELWRYDPSADQWYRETDAPFAGRWRMVMGPWDHQGFWIGLGRDSLGNFPTSVWGYAPAWGWSSLPDFPGTGRTHAAVVQVGRVGVVMGGRQNLSVLLDDVWSFDPQTSNWERLTPTLPLTRSGAMGFAFGSHVYWATGLDSALQRTRSLWTLDLGVVLPSPEGLSSVRLYPNPAQDYFIVEWPAHSNFCADPCTLTLYTLQGQIVLSQSLDSYATRIACPSLSSGVYLAVLQTDSGRRVWRVVKGY